MSSPSQHHTPVTETEKRSRFQLIVFKLGGEEYALVIDQIKEVVITPRVAHVPLMPAYIKGVANIRGNILAIIDLEARFGIAPARETTEPATPHYTLVVASETCRMGILVKEVPNTLTVTETDIDFSPGLIQEGTATDSGYIKGIVRTAHRMIILIDIFKVISRDEISAAATLK